MHRFHISFLIALLLTSSPRIHAARHHPPPLAGPSSPRSVHVQQLFHPRASAPAAGDFQSDKRRVPTGSNPLHNKR
nr:hypothetical protein A4A49_22321 [Ipomoea trifida]